MSRNTKVKLIENAEKSLWTHGYEGTSLNDLVASVGVSKGAFFHHYPSKRAIILEALDKYAAEQIFAPMDKHFASGAIKECLFSWIESLFKRYEKTEFKRGCLLGNCALELSDQDEELREKMKEIFLQWENRLVGIFKPLAAEGKLLMEPRQLARLVISALEGTTLTTKAHKDTIRASREFQSIFQLIELMIKD